MSNYEIVNFEWIKDLSFSWLIFFWHNSPVRWVDGRNNCYELLLNHDRYDKNWENFAPRKLNFDILNLVNSYGNYLTEQKS